ncbi:ABC transporter substrate-binding protein [Ideonella sp. B508-1]|uniref:ABC transporter substrate-binding protein n=1 Tax=Ideonella sp. B508-1 TaxID=137716 RepID=UPI00034900B6|nr:ABC transporter substrate-binding protein [Ideonella sp. B508-1]
MTLRKTLSTVALALGVIGLNAHAANEQYFPLQSYRVGPYAAGGTGFFGGFIDYLQYVNAHGGVNGVQLTWSECETEYVVEKGVECYERLKKGLNGAPAAATNPLSVGIAYATLDRSTADKLPLITINHGRTDSTDGSVFPYVFPLQLNPYSEVSAIVNFIGQKVGGPDKLRGKKVVTLYHGSPYGKETNEVLQKLATKFGFELTLLEVPHPGNEQQSQWLTIRKIKPDSDIALRVTRAPQDTLRGREVGTVAMAVYAPRQWAGAGDASAPATTLPWVGFDAGLACSAPGAWLARNVAAQDVRFRANTLLGAAQAARTGIGCAVLPCFVGGSIPELVRLGPPLDELAQPLWLLMHEDVARVPRMRRASAALAEEIGRASGLMSGLG